MRNLFNLGDLVSFKGGGTPSRKKDEYWDGSIPWATVKDFNSGSKLYGTVESISELGLENSATNLIPKGTVIIPTRMALGKAVLAGIDVAINQDLKAVFPAANLNPRYLLWFFLSHAKQIEGIGKGATVKGVTLDQLKTLKIPLPPLPEQKRIAAILDKADALGEKRRQAIAKLDELLQSVFLDMFGDPVTNPNEWPIEKVSDICKLVRGSSPRPKNDPKYYGGPVPRLMVADLTRDGWFTIPKIDSLTIEGSKKSRHAKAGTVVMAVSGNVGVVSRLKIDACIHDGFVGFLELDEKLILPNVLMLYLSFIKSMHFKITAGAIFKNLTTTDVKNIEVPVPTYKVQKEIDTAFYEILKMKEHFRLNLDKIDWFFASLQHRAFKGEL